ncbi:pantoate--beta-alanine ligase [Arthrobacter tecti]
MYPKKLGTKVLPTVAMDRFEAASRPEHFADVATVITKLFNIVHPHRSYLGFKDYQQLQVVRRVTEDPHLESPTQGPKSCG